jgi:hypothetical protein
MTNEAKTYTLVFTDAELNTIYDAIRELSYMTDDVETLELISDIEGKIYNESTGLV